MTPNVNELADRLESFIPRGDGYNSDYANTLAEAVEVLRAKAAPAEVPYALRQWAMEDEPESTLFDEGYNAARGWVRMQLEKPAEPFQKPTLLKECNVRYSDSSGGVCRSEYKGGPEQTAEPTEAVEVRTRGGRAFDDLVEEMKRDHPNEMALAGEWASGWIDGLKQAMAAKDGDVVKVKVPRELALRIAYPATRSDKANAIEELRALLGGAG